MLGLKGVEMGRSMEVVEGTGILDGVRDQLVRCD